jgi:hypothetical protein
MARSWIVPSTEEYLVMTMQFLRGNVRRPRGHAILIARSSSNPRVVYCTYCVVPPVPMSIAKFLPPMFTSQIPAEELREAANISGGSMPIPPMLEEASSLAYLERLAERRDDDLCDIGSVNSTDEMSRMQMAIMSSNEYGQLYTSSMADLTEKNPAALSSSTSAGGDAGALDDVDADELMLQTMPDRQKLAELGKLIGTARYAIDGHDNALVQETRKKMQRIANLLAAKYRGTELVAAATNPNAQGTRLSELYLGRAFKLLDEEYAEIPSIERAIRDLE